MFDKRLMQMCPESRKYIIGNIILQFLELCLNAVMIVTIAVSVQKLYEKVWTLSDLLLPLIIIACTIFARFFTTTLHAGLFMRIIYTDSRLLCGAAWAEI